MLLKLATLYGILFGMTLMSLRSIKYNIQDQKDCSMVDITDQAELNVWNKITKNVWQNVPNHVPVELIFHFCDPKVLRNETRN